MTTLSPTANSNAVQDAVAFLVRRLGHHGEFSTIHDNMTGKGLVRVDGRLVRYAVADGMVRIDGLSYGRRII